MTVELKAKGRMSVFIIAEAGVNHNGSIETAKKLIDVAADAGADAIKFQSFKAEQLVTPDAQQSSYQSENMGESMTQFQMLKALELSVGDHHVLIEYCRIKHIEFMSTPFDDESIDLLSNLSMKRYKIPSGELLSIPYLRKIARLNRPTILSTGMGNFAEIKVAVDCLLSSGLCKENLSILHANSAYPTPYHDVNLNTLAKIRSLFDVRVGLSDHSLGIEVPIAAVALGAQVIEKHFTLDKTMPGPDHKASLEPDELISMVAAIRNVEKALGSEEKGATSSEAGNILPARKSIVAKCDIKVGDTFSEENITIKRPANGISSMYWDQVVGQSADRNYTQNQQIIANVSKDS